MNRRELLQLGACSFAGAMPVGSAPAQTVAAWRLRVERHARTLAPGRLADALVLRVLLRGASHGPVSVTVENACGEPVRLRSVCWDRDLRLADGASAACLMHAAVDGAVIGVVTPSLALRAQLGRCAPPADVDATFDLPVHHWAAHADPCGGPRLSASTAYRYATLGERLLEASEPLRVHDGQRVCLRFFNASAGRAVSLHLPAHQFEVCALDGVPLATAVRVAQLEIAPGERIDACVEMRHPGRWVLGSLSRTEQQAGFGRLVEYVGAPGRPVNAAPRPVRWSATQLAVRSAAPAWMAAEDLIYDDASPDHRPLEVTPGATMRLLLSNLGNRALTLGARGHRFALCQWNGVEVQGLDKDTLPLPPFTRAAIEVEPRSRVLDLLSL